MEENKEDKDKTLLEKEEKAKRLVLWAGIIFFIILIGILWYFNTRNFFSTLKYEKNTETVDVNALTSDLQKSFSDLNSRMKDLKEIEAVKENLTQMIASSSTSSAPAITTTK